MPLAIFAPSMPVQPQQPELSDAEVFGTATTSPVVAPPPQAHTLAPAGELSDADVFGTATPAAPIAAPPAPEQPSALERVGSNIADAFRHTLTGAVANLIGNEGSSQQIIKNLREQGQNEAADRYARGLEAQRVQTENSMPAWDASGSFIDKAKAGAAALTGQVLGSMASPEGLITDIPFIGKVFDRVAAPVIEKVAPKAVAPAASRIAKAGTTQAVIATATDPAVQGVNIAAGEQKNYDPVQTALAAPLGFLVGGSLHGSGEAMSAMSDAFRSWRAAKAAKAGGSAKVEPQAAPTPQEIDEFAGSPEMAAFMKSSGITKSDDPRIIQLQDRLSARRAAEAERAKQRPQDAGGASTPAFHQDQARLAAEREAVQDGHVDQGAASTAGRTPREPVPDVLPVRPNGQADTGDAAMRAALDKNSGAGGLPVPTEPQPNRMTPDEIARSRAKMDGGNQNTAEAPGRLLGQEDRLPQTPQQAQEQRQAGAAFDTAEAQRARAGADVRDTQPAGRPQGEGQQPVVLDDGFPVQVVSRQTKTVDGKHVEMATVHRYDPRTGQLDPDAIPYEVPVRQLRTKKYAVDPRQAQDFAVRAEGPGNPENPRMATEKVSREADQTYRATKPDPNEKFPGASPEGRSPFPEQPEGPGPFRSKSRFESEAEAMRDFEERQKANQEQPRADQARPDDAKTSTVAAAPGEDGRFSVDDRGFVASDKGGPVKFADQKQAAKWIINQGHKKSPDQIFEIANHPGGKGFTVRERGRADAKAGSEAPSPRDISPARIEGGARGTEGEASPGASPSREARDRAAEDVAQMRQPAPKRGEQRESLFDAMRRHGGIKDQGGDVAQIMQDHRGERFKSKIVRPDGKSPDQMRAALQEEGWFGPTDHAAQVGSRPGDELQDLYDLMDREARGEKIYHPDHAMTDDEAAHAARAMRDEEMNRAGITDKDSPEEAANKLAEYRAQNEADFQAAQDAIDSQDKDWESLHDTDRQIVEDEGYEPGADFGEGEEEPFRAQSRSGQSEDIPGWEKDDGRNDRQAGADQRQAGEAGPGSDFKDGEPVDRQRDIEDEEFGAQSKDHVYRNGTEFHHAREAWRTAQRKQQNPRAFSGKPQEGHAEDGLFGDRSEKNQSDMFAEQEKSTSDLGKKFYSNPAGDPEVWRALGDTLSKVFGWAVGDAREWELQLKRTAMALSHFKIEGEGIRAKIANVTLPIRHLGAVLQFTNDGVLRSMAARLKSEAIKDVADLFFAPPRTGRGGQIGQSYFEALQERQGRWLNALDDALSPFQKMDPESLPGVMDQIGRLVRNPGAIKAGTPIHDAATAIGKMLKEIHTYMREAGVDVGEVKRGYLPRLENTDKILSDQEGFKKAAAKAFRADGMGAKEAQQAADDWFNRIMLGDLGIHHAGNDFLNIGGSNTASFTRGRTLSKKADEILADYHLQNPADILPRYITRATQKAEWSRRLGVRDANAKPPRGLSVDEVKAWREDPLGKWEDIKDRMRAESNGEAIPEVVRIVKSMTGNIGNAAPSVGKRITVNFLRTWSALAYLPRATWASLSEPVNIAIRTGNTMDAARAYQRTLQHWLPIVRKSAGPEYLREMARDLGFIGDATDDLTMLQRSGLDTGSKSSRQMQASFFRQIGLTQLTEANRMAAMHIGMTFIRRLAKDVAEESHYKTISTRHLSELGISEKDAAKFSKWVMDRDGKPNISDLLEGGDMGRIYHTALGRFIGQSVMAPNGAMRPRLAQHPMAGLLYNLMSFNYAFQKNVLNRVAASTKDALGPSGLNARERIYAAMPLLNTALVLLPITYAISEIRDAIFKDPARANQPPMSFEDKLKRVVSRAGLTGSFDPFYNTLTGARYQRDPLVSSLGPVWGGIDLLAADGFSLYSDHNSPNTNTMERKVMKDVYNLVIQPTLEAGALSVMPAGGSLLGAATIGGISHPAARERVVKAVAGPPLPRR